MAAPGADSIVAQFNVCFQTHPTSHKLNHEQLYCTLLNQVILLPNFF